MRTRTDYEQRGRLPSDAEMGEMREAGEFVCQCEGIVTGRPGGQYDECGRCGKLMMPGPGRIQHLRKHYLTMRP